MPLWGGIEAGGTKTVCAVGTGPDDLRAEARFPTTTPVETIQRIVDFFREQAQEEPLAAVGIGTFGPLDLDPHSPRFGYITSTPKPGWANTDLAGNLRRALGTPVGVDTDETRVSRKPEVLLLRLVGSGNGEPDPPLREERPAWRGVVPDRSVAAVGEPGSKSGSVAMPASFTTPEGSTVS